MSTNDTIGTPTDQSSNKGSALDGVEQTGRADATGHLETADESWLTRRLWLMGFRRQVLVNRRRQLRSALLATAPFAVILIVVNVLMNVLRAREAVAITAAAPTLGLMVKDSGRSEMVLEILASLLLLIGIFAVSIIETHRTAGAAFNIGRQLTQVGEGRFNTRLALRKGDNLTELVGPFNRMTQSLRVQAMNDVDQLEELAAGLENREGEGAVREVAEELRTMASIKRQFVEPQE
jgi:hypothetical protein